MITTLFFDIGNVLLGFDHGLIWRRLAAISELSQEGVQQRILTSGLMQLHETGKLSAFEFFHEVQEKAQLPPALLFENFSVLWSDIFWEHKPIIELVTLLQSRYTIFLLSNIGELHWNWLVKQFPIFSRIRCRILSFQVGYTKPTREIYQEALRQSQSLPEHCVYIDDIQEYVQAARMLGIHGIRYHSPEQLQQTFQQLQIA